MLKLIWKYKSEIITILFTGGTTLYCFFNNKETEGFICLLFMFIIYQLINNQRLTKQIGELELKICDLNIKWKS